MSDDRSILNCCDLIDYRIVNFDFLHSKPGRAAQSVGVGLKVQRFRVRPHTFVSPSAREQLSVTSESVCALSTG